MGQGNGAAGTFSDIPRGQAALGKAEHAAGRNYLPLLSACYPASRYHVWFWAAQYKIDMDILVQVQQRDSVMVGGWDICPVR